MRTKSAIMAMLLGWSAGAAPLPVAAHAVDCTCRAPGATYQVGDEACIRDMLATCVMTQNVTSWEMTNRPCPISRRDGNPVV